MMTIPNWLPYVLVGLGAIGTMLLSFNQGVEAEKSREREIRPQLIILAPEVPEFEFQRDLSKLFEVHFRPKDDTSTPVPGHNPIVLRLKNIGAAPAQNIKVTWSLKGDTLEMLKSYLPYKERPFATNGPRVRFTGKEQSPWITWADSFTDEFPYCIASQSSPTTDMLEIPPHLVHSYEFRLVMNSIAIGDEGQPQIELPKIRVKLVYQDLDGKSYTNSVSVTLDKSSYSRYYVIKTEPTGQQ